MFIKLKCGGLLTVHTIKNKEYVALDEAEKYLNIDKQKDQVKTKVVVSIPSLNIRDENYVLKGNLKFGDTLEFLGYNVGEGTADIKGWFKVRYKGKVRYCWDKGAVLYKEEDVNIGPMSLIFGEPVASVPYRSKRCFNFARSISGVFQWQNTVGSIFYYKKWIRRYACHQWLGKPESVLFKHLDGRIGMKRVKGYDELPNDLLWAFGGLGLTNYDPDEEGFCANKFNGKTYDYSDVLRRTGHTGMAVTQNNNVVGFYADKMTAQEIVDFCKKLKFKYAVLFDGGHIAAINSPIKKRNVWQRQNNLIQIVPRK